MFAYRTESRIGQRGAWLLLLAILLVDLACAWGAALAVPKPQQDSFNVLRWEAQHLPNKWLYLTGRFIKGDLSREEEESRLGRYFVVLAFIRRLERDGPPGAETTAQLEAFRDERDPLENDVEAIVEGRLTSVLGDLRLDAAVPLFPNARIVFPPVDFEFEQPLQVVAVSPRDRIELTSQRPLRTGLGEEDVVAIEREIEASGNRSALSESVSGTATYPSIVAHQLDYQRLVETVAHEWVHHYLFFQPLGQHYFDNLETQTLNETLASMAGAEIAELVVARYPLPASAALEVGAAQPPLSEAQIDARLRGLRVEVDRLLAQGDIVGAEALMNRRRDELANEGVVFRRINQAFFAVRDIYADRATSLNPIGTQLQTLRERSRSLQEFLGTAGAFTGQAELEAALTDSDGTERQ